MPCSSASDRHKRLQIIVAQHQSRHVVGHVGKQRVAVLARQPFRRLRARQADLDIDLDVGGIDAGGIVDRIGIDPPAIEGEFDPPSLRDAEIGALADDLDLELAGIDAQAVIGAVAGIGLGFVRRLHIGADAAEPQEIGGG